jgi:hypothetical protein
MRLKGSSLLEIVIALIVWATFIYLFQAYQVQAIYERHIYERNLQHYHIIEQIYMLKTLDLIELDTLVFNHYGVLDDQGLYEVFIFENHFTLYYKGTLIYDSSND